MYWTMQNGFLAYYIVWWYEYWELRHKSNIHELFHITPLIQHDAGIPVVT